MICENGQPLILPQDGVDLKKLAVTHAADGFVYRSGVMGVPVSFFDKYCPEQFEIVAFRKGDDGQDLAFTREREREFNRTFEFLFDGVAAESWPDEQSERHVGERKESLCACSDTTEDMKFFAEYIVAHPESIKRALAERERERADRDILQIQYRRRPQAVAQWKRAVQTDTRSSILSLFFMSITALPCVIKNAEGKIGGKPTYARIMVRLKRNR